MRTITLQGGPHDGQVVPDARGIEIHAPEMIVLPSGPTIITHRYSITDGQHLGIKLHEPYFWWTVEPFPRAARIISKVQRITRALRDVVRA